MKSRKYHLPLFSPAQHIVSCHEWRDPVQGLGPEPAPRIKDGVVGRAREEFLSVRAQAVGCDALRL
jgi:hypothetical protein